MKFTLAMSALALTACFEVLAWNNSYEPQFSEKTGDIFFASQGGTCGRLRIELKGDVDLSYNNKPAELHIRSFRTDYLDRDKNFDQRMLAEKTVDNPIEFGYDWAGPVKQVYHLKCYKKTNNGNKNYFIKTRCDQVVNMEVKYHNQACSMFNRAAPFDTSIFKKYKKVVPAN